MKFSHLHVHTDASLQDGMTPVSELVRSAHSLGFDHLAMTDHGTLANAVAFTLECQEVGIKPILGVEAYLHYENEGKETIGHITLLADGNVGFKNIVKLGNIGHASTFKRPAFTVEDLINHSADVVLLTGCQASPFHNLPLREAIMLGSKLKPYFQDRMYAELMFISDEDRTKRVQALINALRIKGVITNDVHMPLRQHVKVHPILTKMRAGFSYDSHALYLKTPEEVLDIATRFIPEKVARSMMSRTYEIAERLRPVNLRAEPRLPRGTGSGAMLKELTSKAKKIGSEYVSRVNYELKIVATMGYLDYFAILKDIVDYAVANDIKVGPGRGSGASSLILYLLGITDVDPLKFGLSFERFLNPERKGMPDVDIDFDAERRGEVLEYAAKRWKAVPIATYSRYSHKQLTHDLSKQMRVPRDLDAKAADGGRESQAFEDIINKYPDFETAYDTIEGQIRHRGTHAGGVVITDRVIPIERSGKSLAVSWVEGKKNELSYAGFVKFDLLGLSALSILHRLEKRTMKTAQWPPPDGDPVFSLFREGKVEGIFQFSGSQGIVDLTKQLGPTKFDDLVALNALYRPGALDVGTAQKFHEWKKKPRKLHHIIDDILEETHGAIVYQEQVMAIFSRITGGDLASSDSARRVIVKSKEHDRAWVKKFNALRQEFLDGAKKQRLTRQIAIDIWQELAAHSRYSFNKSHSVAYARIAWEMAWFRYHYPEEFFAALLNVDKAKAQNYLFMAVQNGVEVIMPHINVSGDDYEVRHGKLYMPFSAIKFLSETAAKAIEADRYKHGAFTSAEDFMKRLPKRIVQGRARQGLYKIGAFDGLPCIPEDLAINCDPLSIDDDDTTIQRETLGLIVPTSTELKVISQEESKGNVAGIISGMEDRKSNWGPYTVIRVIPFGVFWERSLDSKKKFSVGDLVTATVNQNTGRASSIKRLEA